ncbi:hypothetical protein CNYM01_05736 [Colletotrichum nymphaeae SA-01]|uniref:Uncharacterized protein n=2 Tax=Colletotrichum acutatum species complex TaxID=2707335 RepID=A0A135T6M5_9PEZI|nr:uncharacterized protein CTAM01_15312 [Colletotrichum tamarilloi]KAK1476831.1 hypothetical protein CTAM01_15312 [Colletotrichum tamarilloi]KXH43808.1 hypothetical protein CNYM01_05736 [Colletotrichum nymphaeae SA-01]
MKAAVIFSLVSLALGSVVEKRACAGNNCNRQVTGTRDGLLPITSRQADCSSFMQATVTPSPTTVTVTVTAAPARLRRNGEIANRQVTALPTLIPAYASSCGDSAAYSSACSCWGITAVTTTAPKPTVTVTTTVDYCEGELVNVSFDAEMERLRG